MHRCILTSKAIPRDSIYLIAPRHHLNCASSQRHGYVRNIMAPTRLLFALDIGTTGKITCTEPSPGIYLLTFVSTPDNRLTTSFCESFHLALDIIAHRYPKGVVITTSGIAKFYSNGLDYDNAIKSKDFFPNVLYPLWKRLLTYVSSGLTFTWRHR
jgi:hypothetical protein